MKVFLLTLALLGILDAGYLTYEHFRGVTPPCTTDFSIVDCGTVLDSQYATLFNIPLSLWGILQYTLISFLLLSVIIKPTRLAKYWLILQSSFGFIFSLYLISLQLFILNAICFYCMISALISILLFFGINIHFHRDRKLLFLKIFSFKYQYLLKPIFFKFDPETIHVFMTNMGEKLPRIPFATRLMKFLFHTPTPELAQTYKHIFFPAPLGLAAGFDYEAQLTQVLAPLAFGFQTIGTITKQPYEGNPRPMLGRLPKSKSLLVNKGFKNPGAQAVIEKLTNLKFPIPVGISIGKTNTDSHKTQTDGVEDIITAFKLFEKSPLPHSFYELNISCPNLKGCIEFYTPKHLRELLTQTDKLKLTRPVFIKMPIDKSLEETKSMLDVISKHKISGVIFGNLQKNRSHPAFNPQEIEAVKDLKGNFSGKPTFDQSNVLIRFAYKYYGKQLVIIGCGGIFNAKDAYHKIRAGASLLQLITGMIFQGPGLISQINLELIDLLKKDGFDHISQAIGADVKTKK